MPATKDQPKIIKSRLDKLLAQVSLSSGSHSSRSEGMCMMEAAAYIAGRTHSDHPPCVSSVIGTFGRTWNDALATNDDRDRLLKPLLPDLIGTATTPEDEGKRAWMATDWLVRVHAPAWLRRAGLTAQAEQLESLPELNPQTTPPILPALKAIREDAYKAWDAAWAAAWAAAGDAAGAAAGDAAGAAAGDAARAAAGDAAGDAAWAAAWDAAGDAARDAAGAAARAAAWDAARAAARAAARDAAGAAARAAARDAARAAARAAAWDAAWDAARDYAGDAARDYAGDAAWDALKPTVLKLQVSAQDLVRRMAAVGRVEPVLV